jgi:hypothetical protein
MTRNLPKRLGPLRSMAVLAVALTALTAPAGSQPPPAAKHADVQPVPPPDMARAAKLQPTGLTRIDPVDLGALPVEFGRTRLDDVRKSGGGSVGVRAEPGKAQRWLCYSSSPDRQVWLTTAETGGQTVNGVTLIGHTGIEGQDRCPQLPSGLLPIGAIAGISIGDKREYVEALLGPSRGAEWVTYQTCPKASAAGAQAACIKVTLRFEKNRVFMINAAQTPIGQVASLTPAPSPSRASR